MTLRVRMQMHARFQGAALYQYAIVDEADRQVGTKSVHIDKRKNSWRETATYFLGDDPAEIATAAEFLAAYDRKVEQDKRDAEWSAAEPKEPTA